MMQRIVGKLPVSYGHLSQLTLYFCSQPLTKSLLLLFIELESDHISSTNKKVDAEHLAMGTDYTTSPSLQEYYYNSSIYYIPYELWS